MRGKKQGDKGPAEPSGSPLRSFLDLHTTSHRRSRASRKIHDIARDGNLKELQKFLENNKEEDVESLINSRDEFGKLPLFYASIRGNREIMEYLKQSTIGTYSLQPDKLDSFS